MFTEDIIYYHSHEKMVYQLLKSWVELYRADVNGNLIVKTGVKTIHMETQYKNNIKVTVGRLEGDHAVLLIRPEDVEEKDYRREG